MIVGIGTDIVAVARIARSLDRHGERFAKRILSDGEFVTFSSHVRPAHFLAKRFAAKEALVKALGCGFRDGISMGHIEVENDHLGKPYLVLKEAAAARAELLGVDQLMLSLADEDAYAVAYVVAEKSTFGKC